MTIDAVSSRPGRILGLLLPCLLVASCSDGPAGPVNDVATPTYDLSGSWTIVAHTGNAGHEWQCESTEVGTLQQLPDGRLSGTAIGDNICVIPAGFVRDQGTRDFLQSRLTGSSVSFHLSICRFSGAAQDRDRMSGTVSCTWDFYGTAVTTTGSWSGSRE